MLIENQLVKEATTIFKEVTSSIRLTTFRNERVAYSIKVERLQYRNQFSQSFSINEVTSSIRIASFSIYGFQTKKYLHQYK